MNQAKALPWGRGVKIVQCDVHGLVAVDKPEGILSHPNRKGDNVKSVLVCDYDSKRQVYCVKGDDGVTEVFLINRLDSATSGILLLALNEGVADAVKIAFANKKARKTYAALVFGIPRRGSPVWRDRLSVRHAEGGVRAKAGSGVLAETRLLDVKPLAGIPLVSRLTLMPVTGRTHQLRIQSSKRGIPIVGDRTYGDFSKNKLAASAKGVKRLCLHCVGTELDYFLNGERCRFKASSPASF